MRLDLKQGLDLGSKATGCRAQPGEPVAKKKLEGRPVDKSYQHMKQAEKMEIIPLVEQSELSVKATLKELGIHRSTFYQWYKRYLEKGYDGLADRPVERRGYWNVDRI